MSFTIFQNKNGHFSQLLFLGNIGQENVFYNILEQENACLGQKKKMLKKVEKLTFFQRGYLMVLVQKWKSFQVFFCRIQFRKRSFTVLYNEKTPLQAIKTRSLKSRKIDIFPKSLTDGSCAKMAILSYFFFCNIGQENVFYGILQRKNSFLAYKNKKFKKSKN